MQLYRLDPIMVEFVPKSAESAFFRHFWPKIDKNRPKMKIFTKIAISQKHILANYCCYESARKLKFGQVMHNGS